jgi:predicted DNA-binding mobile mystery protein A
MPSAEEARRARRRLDVRLVALQPPQRYAVPPAGWLRAVRDALGMSQADLGRRLDIAPQAVQQIEAGERDGSVRLATLRRAADAMDCDLAYVLLPRTTLESTVTAQALRVVDREIAATERTMALEDQATTVSEDTRRTLVDRLVASKRLWRQ